MSTPLSPELIERCANDRKGAVALHLRQELLPVEGRGAPFFPATYAMDSKYNIDTLPDGTQVVLVDSVGSQANRLEPIFQEEELRDLVPQITITYGDETKGNAGSISILEAGHRLGDAVIRCTPLGEEARAAFLAAGKGDMGPVARLAPTTLVFGAWDSRDTGVKLPRLVQATIRAWDVARLSRSAQYVPALDYEGLGLVPKEEDLKGADEKFLAERGFIHVPSTDQHGGVVASGPIRRDVTVNLVALRRMEAEEPEALRRYLLGITLVAATAPVDPDLRQGCLLVPDQDSPAVWTLVERDGNRTELSVDRGAVLEFARSAAKAFGVASSREAAFDAKLAKADMTKKKKGKAKK